MAPPSGIYDVSYFSQVDWRTIRAEVIATDEAQVRAWADARCKPEFRGKVRMGIKCNDPADDSLKIVRLCDVPLPYVISSNLR